MKVYHVTTKKRSYNSVSSPKAFRKTRRITKDYTPVVSAQRWDSKAQAWVKAGKKQFHQKYGLKPKYKKYRRK